MPRTPSSRKKIPTEVWVALIGLIGVLIAAILSSPILLPLVQRTPVPGPTDAASPNGSATNSPASPTADIVLTPKPVDESVVIITLQNGSVVELPMSSFYTNFGDTKSLLLYSGVAVPFTKIKSFEVVEDLGENNIVVTIVLLDGSTSTERIDEYAAASGELEGETSFGHFLARFHELKKVEFQR